jgi:hypothetical protein
VQDSIWWRGQPGVTTHLKRSKKSYDSRHHQTAMPETVINLKRLKQEHFASNSGSV